MNLSEFFKINPKAAMGFSGGVDSAYLLYAAKKYGADIQPYYIKTEFQPRFEYEHAMRLCEELKASVKIIEYNILSEPDIAENPQNRCYYCKRRMFSLLKERADKDGYSLIIDGTNASDAASERPGMTALSELAVRSPLRECGLTKAEIRALSKKAGLFTWDKPAYACLATRIPTDMKITAELLTKIEKSENALAEMGFSDFRVRIYHGAARLQVRAEQFEMAACEREKILQCLSPYFGNVLLDLKER
ncbi:MAG: ATP-dependent sacrificial sulfur transferase LarE [Oscillospiraceae bacterium]|nr:ATP-dependent sacrificial sulfur transferase LarE [Oscillospiraceae bacterium]